MKLTNNRNSIKKTGVILILTGFIVILLTYIFYIMVKGASDNVDIKKIKEIIFQVFLCCGTTVATIGAGTVLYGTFDIIDYTQKQIEEVLIKNKFVDKLNNSEKEELMNRLAKELKFKSDEAGCLYDFVQKEIASLTSLPFYEELTITIDCRKEGNRIKKTIQKNYTLNCEADREFDIISNNSFYGVYMDVDNEASIKEKYLRIEDMEFKDADFEQEECDKLDNHTYSKQLKYSLNEECKNKVELICENKEWNLKYKVITSQESIVDDKDIVFTYRILYPCKKANINFTYKSEEFNVIDDYFVFKDTDISGDNKNINVVRNNSGIYIQFRDWILPGDGVTFVLTPPEMLNNCT